MPDPIVHLCGMPDWVHAFGPLEIEHHHYMGPGFFWLGENFIPRRFSPLWVVYGILRRREERHKHAS